jgi:hypothetical protein
VVEYLVSNHEVQSSNPIPQGRKGSSLCWYTKVHRDFVVLKKIGYMQWVASPHDLNTTGDPRDYDSNNNSILSHFYLPDHGKVLYAHMYMSYTGEHTFPFVQRWPLT